VTLQEKLQVSTKYGIMRSCVTIPSRGGISGSQILSHPDREKMHSEWRSTVPRAGQKVPRAGKLETQTNSPFFKALHCFIGIMAFFIMDSFHLPQNQCNLPCKIKTYVTPDYCPS